MISQPVVLKKNPTVNKQIGILQNVWKATKRDEKSHFREKVQ